MEVGPLAFGTRGTFQIGVQRFNSSQGRFVFRIEALLLQHRRSRSTNARGLERSNRLQSPLPYVVRLFRGLNKSHNLGPSDQS